MADIRRPSHVRVPPFWTVIGATADGTDATRGRKRNWFGCIWSGQRLQYQAPARRSPRVSRLGARGLDGRYLLCRLPIGVSTHVWASKTGYAVTDVNVQIDGSGQRDLEIRR